MGTIVFQDGITTIEKIVLFVHTLDKTFSRTCSLVECDGCNKTISSTSSLYCSSTSVGNFDYCENCDPHLSINEDFCVEDEGRLTFKKNENGQFSVSYFGEEKRIPCLVGIWATNIEDYITDFGYPVNIEDQHPEKCATRYSMDKNVDLLVYGEGYSVRQGIVPREEEPSSTEEFDITEEAVKHDGFKSLIIKGCDKITVKGDSNGGVIITLYGISNQIAKNVNV